jgi:hypothetical protein
MTIEMDENSVTYNTLIKEYVLEPNQLVFVIRHNSLLVMSYEKYLAYPPAVQLVLYNCRDILVGLPIPTEPSHHSGGEGVKSLDGESLEKSGPTQLEPDQETFTDIEAREQQLADLIRSTVRNEDFPWTYGSNLDEQCATIQAFDGLLVVRALPETHEQLRRFLRLLRESAKEQSWPAELGDWPHGSHLAPPPSGEKLHGAGTGYF